MLGWRGASSVAARLMKTSPAGFYRRGDGRDQRIERSERLEKPPQRREVPLRVVGEGEDDEESASKKRFALVIAYAGQNYQGVQL